MSDILKFPEQPSRHLEPPTICPACIEKFKYEAAALSGGEPLMTIGACGHTAPPFVVVCYPIAIEARIVSWRLEGPLSPAYAEHLLAEARQVSKAARAALESEQAPRH